MSLIILLGACAGPVQTADVAPFPVADHSGIPVSLTAEIVSLEPAEAAVAQALSAAKVGQTIEVTAVGLPVCARDGLELTARRIDVQLEIDLRGGGGCPPGKSGHLLVKVEDRPGNYSANRVVLNQLETGAIPLGPVVIEGG